jgi:hypothetical protein
VPVHVVEGEGDHIAVGASGDTVIFDMSVTWRKVTGEIIDQLFFRELDW